MAEDLGGLGGDRDLGEKASSVDVGAVAVLDQKCVVGCGAIASLKGINEHKISEY